MFVCEKAAILSQPRWVKGKSKHKQDTMLVIIVAADLHHGLMVQRHQ